MSNQSKDNDYSNEEKLVYGCAVAGAVGIIAYFGAPIVVSAMGFKSTGIASGSYAASIMSTLGGATTPAGGIVATGQSIGTAGAISKTTAAGVGAATAYFIRKFS